MKQENILKTVADSIVVGDGTLAREAAERALDAGMPAQEVVNDGLVVGMRIIGEQWKTLEIFLPEVMLAVEAWRSAMEVVGPSLSAEAKDSLKKGVVVLGSVKGDIHEIGKNIVGILLETAGFEVHDIGYDNPASAFVTAAEKANADIIAASALMTTTMPYQKEIVDYLVDQGLRDKYFVMVGGGPVSAEWAAQIGADAHGRTAEDAVRLALEHMQRRQNA